jgi:hypothetical protein
VAGSFGRKFPGLSVEPGKGEGPPTKFDWIIIEI